MALFSQFHKEITAMHEKIYLSTISLLIAERETYLKHERDSQQSLLEAIKL